MVMLEASKEQTVTTLGSTKTANTVNHSMMMTLWQRTCVALVVVDKLEEEVVEEAEEETEGMEEETEEELNV